MKIRSEQIEHCLKFVNNMTPMIALPENKQSSLQLQLESMENNNKNYSNHCSESRLAESLNTICEGQHL